MTTRTTSCETLKPKLSMLVAGGCHVFGHPFGAARSFTAIAVNRLLEFVEIKLDALHINLKTSGDIVNFLANEQVDVLVIQLG